jgi:hypothetical protein
MAFVVRRPRGRWEIRESFVGQDGPRARTLASFRVLSDDVIEKALGAARRPADRDSIILAAKRSGAPLAGSEADSLAEPLLRCLAEGKRLRPGLRDLLIDFLERPTRADDSFAEWIGASLEDRAMALIDLLGLGDSLPAAREGPLNFPRLGAVKTQR